MTVIYSVSQTPSQIRALAREPIRIACVHGRVFSSQVCVEYCAYYGKF